jgi:hypothetical protein
MLASVIQNFGEILEQLPWFGPTRKWGRDGDIKCRGASSSKVDDIVIDTVLNILFRCAHRHLTRPFTPVGKGGAPYGETDVVCLDCAKQFAYDFKEMRIGKALDHSHDACVIPPNMPKPVKTKLRYALGVAVPVQRCCEVLSLPEAARSQYKEPRFTCRNSGSGRLLVVSGRLISDSHHATRSALRLLWEGKGTC